MRAPRALLTAFVLLAANTVLGQQHPNLARGFAPEKLYDFSAVDTVNLFNGDLIVRIPIGPQLHINGALGYQFHLGYNSHSWDYYPVDDNNHMNSVPMIRSNAGMGWIFSMGRLFVPGQQDNSSASWIYESPDGADHGLYAGLHGEADDHVHLYSHDSSYIRLTSGGDPHVKTLELPDGTTQTFTELNPRPGTWSEATSKTNEWRLTTMSDRFNNIVTIGYSESLPSDNPQYSEVWTVTNGTTTTMTAYFQKDTSLVGGTTSWYDALVEHVVVLKEGSGTSTYSFRYTPARLSPGFGDNDTPGKITVALLTSIDLPDSTSFSATYDVAGTPTDPDGTITPGVLTSLALPTGGTVSWVHDEAVFNRSTWGPPRTNAPVPRPPEVFSRSFGGGTWTYGAKASTEPCTDPTTPPKSYDASRQKTGWVIAPDQTATIGYFATYSSEGELGLCEATSAQAEGWDENLYGLPFTRYCVSPGATCGTVPLGSPAQTFYVSREVHTGFSPPVNWNGQGRTPLATGETVLRSTWVNYDYDSLLSGPPLGQQNARLTSTVTGYEDDSGCSGTCYAGVNSLGFDGFGHFKQSSSFGNFPGTANFRTSFTNYTTALDGAGDWILGTYSEQCTVDEASQRTTPISGCGDLSKAAVTQTSFDPSTGALLARRVKDVKFADGSVTDSHDLLAVFGYNSGDHGLVSDEKYYGGDQTPLSTSSGFTTTTLPDYEIDHTYTFSSGALTKVQSKYHGASFYFEDADLDPATGLITAFRDTSTLPTTYAYDDPLSRLTTMTPPGLAATTYTYTNAGTGTPAKVKALTTSSQGLGTIGKEYQFDPWGRLTREKSEMYNGSWSAVVTQYDGLGRKASVGMPEVLADTSSPTNVTSYAYDAFNRLLTVTQPDSTSTSMTYTGVRRSDRSVSVAGPSGSQTATTTETYDALGRLIEVDEPSGDANSMVATTYGYDAGDRLTSVQTGVQTRSFVYDGRGLLVTETHPEKGTTSYIVANADGVPGGYDARGHVYRRVDGSAYGPFDLTYTYDIAERLVSVQDFDQSSQTTPKTQRTLKAFTFATSNSPVGCADTSAGGCDARNAKLLTATRYNRRNGAIGDVMVAEVYSYEGRGGLPSARDTTLQSAFPFLDRSYEVSQEWNDLGLVSSTSYPAECIDGDCFNLSVSPIVSRTYTNGFLATITGSTNAYIDGITYQPNGLVSTVHHHNNTFETWTPNPEGMSRPCSIYVTLPGTNQNTSTDPCSNQNAFWTSGTYSYDGAGNIKALGGMTYVYDGVSRLKGAGAETFGYDIYGNITNHTGTAVSVDASTNRLLAVGGTTYDAAGNLATWHDPTLNSTRVVSYEWDALGSLQHLTDKGSIAPNPLLPDLGTGNLDTYHVYTADDERVASVDMPLGQYTAYPINALRYTLRGFNNELLTTYTLQPTSLAGWMDLFPTENDIWRGKALAAIDTPAGVQHFTLDHLGSPRVVTDSTGNYLSEATFAPFGTGGVTGTTVLQFTGHERDKAASPDTLDYMHARFYSPSVGRFLSVDQIHGDTMQPQSWNHYAYTHNNPLNRVDTTGMADGLSETITVVAGGRGDDSLLDPLNQMLSSFLSLRWAVDAASSTWDSARTWVRAHPYEATFHIANGVLILATDGASAAVDESIELVEEGGTVLSEYVEATEGRSVTNILTDVTKETFESNLHKNGFVRSVSKDGQVANYVKDGVKYSVRGFSRSGGATADVFKAGIQILKIRLGL